MPAQSDASGAAGFVCTKVPTALANAADLRQNPADSRQTGKSLRQNAADWRRSSQNCRQSSENCRDFSQYCRDSLENSRDFPQNSRGFSQNSRGFWKNSRGFWQNCRHIFHPFRSKSRGKRGFTAKMAIFHQTPQPTRIKTKVVPLTWSLPGKIRGSPMTRNGTGVIGSESKTKFSRVAASAGRGGMIPPSGSGRSAPLPAMTVALRKSAEAAGAKSALRLLTVVLPLRW